MGSDLIINLLEIERGKKPDWDAAEKFIASLTAEDCAKALAVVNNEDLDEVDLDLYLGAGEQEVRNALDACINGWNGVLRAMVKIPLGATDMLIAADISSDATEEMKQLHLFAACGAADAAGFLDLDSRVACWLNREDAQRLVDRHAAYTEKGIQTDHDDVHEEWELEALEDEMLSDLVPVVDALGTILKAQPVDKEDEDQ